MPYYTSYLHLISKILLGGFINWCRYLGQNSLPWNSSTINALHKNYEGKHLFCAVCEKVTKEKKKKKIPDNMYI
jgi:hypothetical protein